MRITFSPEGEVLRPSHSLFYPLSVARFLTLIQHLLGGNQHRKLHVHAGEIDALDKINRRTLITLIRCAHDLAGRTGTLGLAGEDK